MAKADHQSWQAVSWPDAQAWEPKLIIPQTRRWFGAKAERAYTFQALAWARRTALHIKDFNLDRDRYIILSDTHKGDRSRGSDEFQINDALYCHALDHYLNGDYRLVLNGDIEEGWKASYSTIIEAYESTAFAKEREFAQRGPGYYLRTFGNHDMEWANPALVDRDLAPALGRPVKVHAAIVLGDRIMIAHGHQGEFNSDRLAWLSRRIIRYLWKPLQRALDFAPRRTAQNYDLVHKRDKFLGGWARAHRMLLIAGHTHQPTMTSLALRKPDNEGNEGNEGYYLNDGCCVHRHSITGIEIDQGEIRLVKWDSDAHTGDAMRTVFQRSDLGAYLAQL